MEQIHDDSALSPAELAKRFGVSYDALRKRLERLRSKDHDCFMEVSNRKPQAQYLYKVGHVRPVIADMKKPSNEASSQLPATKKGR